MRIVCIQTFGDCNPGDEREVPDGSEVSAMYFKVMEPPKERASRKPAAKATAPKLEKDEG